MREDDQGAARPGSRARRRLYAGLGLVCLAIGVIGVLLPGLPGTLFLLAASYLFVRSSPRLDRWMREHPRLGPPLRQAESGAMPLRAKVVVLVAIWASVVAVLVLGAGHILGRVALVALGIVGTGVILFRIRTAPPAPEP